MQNVFFCLIRVVYDDLLKSEETFVNELRFAIDNYVHVLETGEAPTDVRVVRDQLFLNFKDLYNFHAK